MLTNKEKNQRFFCPSPFPKSRKAQAWSFDIIVAVVIFLIGLVVLYVYAINYVSQTNDNLEELFYEANIASELVLSNDDFGILSDNKVNQTKLNDYNVNYDVKKERIGVLNNFYFTLDEGQTYYGKLNTTSTEENIKVTRLTIHNNKPTKFEIFIWRS